MPSPNPPPGPLSDAAAADPEHPPALHTHVGPGRWVGRLEASYAATLLAFVVVGVIYFFVAMICRECGHSWAHATLRRAVFLLREVGSAWQVLVFLTIPAFYSPIWKFLWRLKSVLGADTHDPEQQERKTKKRPGGRK